MIRQYFALLGAFGLGYLFAARRAACRRGFGSAVCRKHGHLLSGGAMIGPDKGRYHYCRRCDLMVRVDQ